MRDAIGNKRISKIKSSRATIHIHLVLRVTHNGQTWTSMSIRNISIFTWHQCSPLSAIYPQNLLVYEDKLMIQSERQAILPVKPIMADEKAKMRARKRHQEKQYITAGKCKLFVTERLSALTGRTGHKQALMISSSS